MRQFKSEFHAGTDKNIIVVNCYVPSTKRRKAMTPEQKKLAKQWAKDVKNSINRFLKEVTQ